MKSAGDGQNGKHDILTCQIRCARAVVTYILNHLEFELLPQRVWGQGDVDLAISIVGLLAAKDEGRG